MLETDGVAVIAVGVTRAETPNARVLYMEIPHELIERTARLPVTNAESNLT
jgi:hypothetical protein